MLGIQIDAAINPGNSGGPAFMDLDTGKVAGVAFSKNVMSSTDNIGYIIPHQVRRALVGRLTDPPFMMLIHMKHTCRSSLPSPLFCNLLVGHPTFSR